MKTGPFIKFDSADSLGNVLVNAANISFISTGSDPEEWEDVCLIHMTGDGDVLPVLGTFEDAARKIRAALEGQPPAPGIQPDLIERLRHFPLYPPGAGNDQAQETQIDYPF